MLDIQKTVNEYKTVLILLLVGMGIIIVAFFLSMIKWLLLLTGVIMIGSGGYLVYNKIKKSKAVNQIKKIDLTK
jgi:hypothetical protein